jgi:hypothetical protein
MKSENSIEICDVTKYQFLPIYELMYKGEVTIPKKDSEQFVNICKKFSIILDSVPTIEEKSIQTNEPIVTFEPKPNKNINDLPLEIILKILSYLPTSDLLLNVACVSKSFNKLTHNPGVHR